MTSSTKPATSPSPNNIACSRHLALAIAAALAAGPVAATTIEVGGGCTLADAISAINTQQVAGGCPAGTGDNDTIVLPAGTLVIDDWLPIINADMVIEGQGRDQTTVDGDDSFRPFFVRGGTVVFRDLTIANGLAEGGTGKDGGGGGAGLGGALLVKSGNVALERVDLVGNSARGGNAVGASDVSGGGGGGLAGDGGDAGLFPDGGGGGGGGWFGDGGFGGAIDPRGGDGQGYGAGGGGGRTFGGNNDGGAGGQGGAGGIGSGSIGGGGGSDIDGENAPQGDGAHGGFGNGGGGSGGGVASQGGNGGFGGGGGGAGEYLEDVGHGGGHGGFGGGGGGGGLDGNGGDGGLGGGGGGSYFESPGSGGFGAGNGGGFSPGPNGGGGGLGGAVFVRSGELRLDDVLFSGNSATGGLSDRNNGQGFGGALFLCSFGNGEGQIDHVSAGECNATVHADSTLACFTDNQAADGQPDVFGPWNADFEAGCNDADLAIGMERTSPTPGPDWIRYRVVVSNFGPQHVTGALVNSSLDAGLIDVIWSCQPGPGGACADSGVGNLDGEPVDLDSGSEAVFQIFGELANPQAAEQIVSSATVTPPAEIEDPEPDNNSATVSVQVRVFRDRFEP